MLAARDGDSVTHHGTSPVASRTSRRSVATNVMHHGASPWHLAVRRTGQAQKLAAHPLPSSTFHPRSSNLKHYSYRNAINGTTLVARRAGTRQAARATPNRTAEMTTNVAGSV